MFHSVKISSVVKMFHLTDLFSFCQLNLFDHLKKYQKQPTQSGEIGITKVLPFGPVSGRSRKAV
jgi:hypothetical protein